MSTFIQLHLLTSYPPANLNRDDLGRPKTAVMGGVQRLRISSQSLKRAWRTSDLFEEALAGHIGIRTKEKGLQVFDQLRESGINEKQSKEWAMAVAGEFGKLKGKSDKNPLQDLEIEQLAHFSPDESQAIEVLIRTLIKEKRKPIDEELHLLRKKHKGVDIALFGRMLASNPEFNVEAAAQVAHAITVHKVAVEDDYFTAVDDLNKGEEDMGAAHIGETEFAAGLFYLYICINRDLLIKNIQGDEELAVKTLRALTEAAATIAPTGKQNSFASRAYASYILAEKGRKQPRSLSVAFLKPVTGTDILTEAINSLENTRDNMDQVYGPICEDKCQINAVKKEGTLEDLLKFVASPLP
ncbi:MAG: type I-E CRISPR-associated protein Cas7/Cse4/CasC [Proteobacteria bacterium]|nr:type I-E CRISPR-associated protein Cas7/Cse4/CasC [Pseudomonadota bacterium]